MNSSEIRSNFHNLIDSIDNYRLLEQFYELMYKKINLRDGELWNKLSKEDQNELIAAEKSSRKPKNVVAFTELKNKHAKWL